MSEAMYDDDLGGETLGELEAQYAAAHTTLKPVVAETGPGRFSPSVKRGGIRVAFMDDDHLLPKAVRGCLVYLLGDRETHKTGFAIKCGLDEVQRGGRVLYICAEDADGFSASRLPAAAKARGIEIDTEFDKSWQTLDTDFRLLEACAPEIYFNQVSEAVWETYWGLVDASGLTDLPDDFNPTLIIIDVLSATLPGADLSSLKTQSEAIAALEKLSSRWYFDDDDLKVPGATVLICAHPSGTSGKEPMGGKAWANRAYAMLHTKVKRDFLEIEVTRSKIGGTGRKLTFPINADPDDGTPVIGAVINSEASSQVEKAAAPKKANPAVSKPAVTDADRIIAVLTREPRKLTDILDNLGITEPKEHKRVWSWCQEGKPLAPYATKLGRTIYLTRPAV